MISLLIVAVVILSVDALLRPSPPALPVQEAIVKKTPEAPARKVPVPVRIHEKPSPKRAVPVEYQDGLELFEEVEA